MRSVEGRTKRGNRGGNREIYDRLVDENLNQPIIAVERIIDCLSIRKVVRLPVVAVDGAGEFRRLSEWTTRKFSSFNVPKFILLGDNNDGGAGQKGAKAGVEELRHNGFLAVSKILSPDKRYDANEYLQEEGAAKLAVRIQEIVEESKAERLIKSKPNPLSMAEIHRGGYGAARANLLSYYSKLKTRFEKWDEKQIVSAGIYLLCGLTGIEKKH